MNSISIVKTCRQLNRSRRVQLSLGLLFVLQLLRIFLPDSYYIITRIVTGLTFSAALLVASAIHFECDLTLPRKSFADSLVTRLAAASGLSITGFVVGSQYVHLCHAGVKWLEVIASLFVPPMIAMAIMCLGVQFRSVVPSCLIVVAMTLCNRPYLDWAHGESTKWAALFDRCFLSAVCWRHKYDLRNGMSLQTVEKQTAWSGLGI
jgi:hypothetical protein